MHFALIDTVLELDDSRVVAIKNVSLAEEYLGDHFPGFPVLPGVFMLEALVQASRRLLERSGGAEWVLGEVKALRYGSFVRPGEALRVEVVADGGNGAESRSFKGTASVVRAGAIAETAASGRFTMRPPRIAQAPTR